MMITAIVVFFFFFSRIAVIAGEPTGKASFFFYSGMQTRLMGQCN